MKRLREMAAVVIVAFVAGAGYAAADDAAERQPKDHYEAAKRHEREHPEDYRELIRLYRAVADHPDFRFTIYGAYARSDISRARARWIVAGIVAIRHDDRRMARVQAAPRVVLGAKDVPAASPPRAVAFERPYLLDVHEVTNHDYWVYCEDVGLPFDKRPRHWDRKTGEYPEAIERHPVVNVTFADAEAFATWAGKRLPTADEWEYAARGTDGRPYPWGAEFGKPPPANVAGGRTRPVGSFPAGASPFGCLDMIGNVFEWTTTDRVPHPALLPAGPAKEIRGGSSRTVGPPALVLEAAQRFFAPPGEARPDLGFRCAKDVE